MSLCGRNFSSEKDLSLHNSRDAISATKDQSDRYHYETLEGITGTYAGSGHVIGIDGASILRREDGGGAGLV
jgi:hypothetical protein